MIFCLIFVHHFGIFCRIGIQQIFLNSVAEFFNGSFNILFIYEQQSNFAVKFLNSADTNRCWIAYKHLPCAVVANLKSSYLSTNLCMTSVWSRPNRTASLSTEAQLTKTAQNWNNKTVCSRLAKCEFHLYYDILLLKQNRISFRKQN